MTRIASTSNLTGRHILVVEDEFMLAVEAEALLAGAGCHVLGPVPSHEDALAILEKNRPDAVMLDLNLDGKLSVELAEHLRRERIPFVVVSGYGENQLRRAALDDVPFVAKPFDARHLLSTLAGILA